MQEPQVADRLELRWVPVVDGRGLTHLEARWTTASHATAALAPHAAA